MAQTENQKKLLKILNEIFQLDQSDLDFGIYRIMNSKSKEINEFLDKDLLSSVASAFSSNDNHSTQKELDEAVRQAQSLGADPETLPKVIALREQLSSTTTSSNLENDVFSHLSTFFKRYYKDGDFVSLRRYKKDTYVIPYEGEEVKLHWANSDQYYIKSGEYFRDYTFTVNGKTIHLKLSDAETESNNNKATSDKERRFVILESNPCEVINDELYINFEYKAVGKEKQDKLNESAIAKALETLLLAPKLQLGSEKEFTIALNTLAPTEKNKKRTLFEKHLKSYTSRNSFDYFIHKDLGGFLGRELDFYIKNEMLFLDDIMDSPIKYEEVMGKIKIFKTVSQKIIAFLTQLEELQKRLWEKKKFIIETNYCITLDKVNEEYYEQILSCNEQLVEWKTLFDVDVKTIQDLKDEKYLVLDTKFFDTKFKYKLLSEFDNLDEDIDGVLINSENFGALTLLQHRYKEQIQTVYIDPPYNTGNDGFLYADTFQHSSWMSFMYDRLNISKTMMKNTGLIFTQIDDYEHTRAKYILDEIFSENNFINNVIWRRKGGKTSPDTKRLENSHDYILIYEKNNSQLNLLYTKDGSKEYIKKSFTGTDENGRKYQSTALNAPKYRPTLVYEFMGYQPPKNGWSVTPELMMKYYEAGKLILPKDKDKRIRRKQYLDEWLGYSVNSIWTDIKVIAAASKERIDGFTGQKPETLIKRCIDLSSDINNVDIVLDFFGGSGTTSRTAYKMNKKFISIEMGEYFDTFMLNKMKNTLYGNAGGMESKRRGGLVKYFKLESYEDTLNNLEFKRTKEQEETLGLYPQAKDDYILNYSLDVESQASLLNIDTFKTPFDYKLKIATSSVGETKDTAIDLVETFNYLLGLVVKRIEMLKGYLVVEGQNLKKEKILIIWRDGQNSEELNEFFKKMDWSVYDREFDTIYVNGDNNLDNLRNDKVNGEAREGTLGYEDHYKVKLIEQEFKKLMFGE